MEERQRPGLCGVLWLTWDKFWKDTSISGLCNAGNSASFWRRLIWLAIFVLFFLLTIVGVEQVLEEYFEYPVDTQVGLAHQTKVIFNKTDSRL